jgi:hypothetical protein
MSKIPFDPERPNAEAVRQIVITRLKNDPNWCQLDSPEEGFDPYVEYIGQRHHGTLAFQVCEVFWQLMVEGILAPGMDSANMKFPWFHRTEYGKTVLQSEVPTPHDPTGYLDRLSQSIQNLDSTVFAYLSESLACFRKGNGVRYWVSVFHKIL